MNGFLCIRWVGVVAAVTAIACSEQENPNVADVLEDIGSPDTGPDVEDVAPPPEPYVGEPTLAAVVEHVIRPSCAAEGCHKDDPGKSNGYLSMADNVVYRSLVNAPPNNIPAEEEGMLRVHPGRPHNSFLMLKIELSDLDVLYGSPMPPLASPPLEDWQIELVRAWIQQERGLADPGLLL